MPSMLKTIKKDLHKKEAHEEKILKKIQKTVSREHKAREPKIDLAIAKRTSHPIRRAERISNPQLRQYLGSTLDPATFGPMHMSISGYDPADWTAADATNCAVNIPSSDFSIAVGLTQSNVALAYNNGGGIGSSLTFENFLPIGYQLPNIEGAHKCALRTLTLKLDLDISVASKGFVLAGCIPVEETFGTLTSLNISIDECNYYKTLKRYSFSEIAAMGGLTLPWHRLSPLADQYKLTTSMTTAFSAEAEKSFATRKKFAPFTAIDPNSHAVRSNDIRGTRPSPAGLPGAVGDNYIPTLDCMVPFVLIANEDAAAVTSRIQVLRTWDLVFEFGDSQMIPIARGNNAVKPIPEHIQAIGNTILKHFPAVPSHNISQLVDTLSTYGKEAVNWANSPDGKQTIKTALEVLGTGVSVGAALLPALL